MHHTLVFVLLPLQHVLELAVHSYTSNIASVSLHTCSAGRGTSLETTKYHTEISLETEKDVELWSSTSIGIYIALLAKS